MRFEQHNIKLPLSNYVERIFHFENFMPDHPTERVVPTGHIYIIFELDGYTRYLLDNTDFQPIAEFNNVWISGMHRNFITISAHKKSEMLVIQFKPYGAFPFLNVPVLKLNDSILPGESFFGKDILSVRKKLIETSSTKDKFSLIEKWLTQRFNAENVPPYSIIEILKKLQKETASKYLEILSGYPNTHKHLIHQFKKFVGLNPKYYQRILRFSEILNHIQKKEKISWSQVAYHCNFSDQSHFIKEFKHFSGFNPKEFILKDFHKDETNFFPLKD